MSQAIVVRREKRDDTAAELRRINELLESETRRMAHTLHDGAGQLLAAIHLALARAAREAPSPSPHLTEIRGLVEQLEAQLRRLSRELRPTVLEDLGLVPALRDLVDGVSERTGIRVRLEASLQRRYTAALETAAYRIVMEALTNIGRHSGASEALVLLDDDAGVLRCVVRDNGAGFDAAVRNGGLGLLGMRRRAAAFGGRISIRSKPGCGAEIEVIFRSPVKAI